MGSNVISSERQFNVQHISKVRSKKFEKTWEISNKYSKLFIHFYFVEAIHLSLKGIVMVLLKTKRNDNMSTNKIVEQ